MSVIRNFLFLLAICLILPACKSMEVDVGLVNRLKATPSGNIMYQSFKRQGLPVWSGLGCLTCRVHTEETGTAEDGEAEDTRKYEADFLCDTRLHRVKAEIYEGDSGRVRVYADDTYWESLDGEKVQDPDALLVGRSALMEDYLFNNLTYLVPVLPATFASESGPSVENIGGVAYYVIELSFDGAGPVAPLPWYRLYYGSSTCRLEKVFYQGREGDLKGKYIWCEFENFQEVDGFLVPHYREFSLAEDRKGRKWTGIEPFKKQWILDARFSGSLEDGTFSP